MLLSLSLSQFELLMKEFNFLVLEVTCVHWFMLLLMCLCLELVVLFCFSWYEILSWHVPKLCYYGAIGISLDWKWYLTLGCGWTI